MYRTSFCRFCSTEKEDLRLTKHEKGTIRCLSCGNLLLQVPSEQKPYFYLKEVEYG